MVYWNKWSQDNLYMCLAVVPEPNLILQYETDVYEGHASGVATKLLRRGHNATQQKHTLFWIAEGWGFGFFFLQESGFGPCKRILVNTWYKK